MSFLWVDCSETQPDKKANALQAARQHVMIDFHTKKDISKSKATIPKHNVQQATPPKEDISSDDGNSSHGPKTALNTARQAKTRQAKRAKQTNSRALPAKNAVPPLNRQELMTPPLTPALISTHDQKLYQAAWWHSYHTRPNEGGHWIAACRTAWAKGFWDFAKDDETLREIFFCYAAAKEATVKDAQDSKSYYVHKGRALQLISKDLQCEGRDLRLAGIVTMCLLAKASFIEQDFEAAESHLRAISSLVYHRLQDLPSFLWLFVVWADLRLTAVKTRPPVLPYCLHPNFNDALLPANLAEQARFLASCNALSLPSLPVISQQTSAALLFELLHGLALSYNKADELGSEWLAPWALSYQIAYKISKLRNRLHQLPRKSGRDKYNPENVIIIAASMSFWAISMQFVPQPGSMRHHQEQMAMELVNIDPKCLLDQWSEAKGSLDSLLWALFMAGAYALKERVMGLRMSAEMPVWLWKDLHYLLKSMQITTFEKFESILQTFPFANHWNKRLAGPVYVWVQTGFALGAPSPRPPGVLFAELRLTFDSDADERMDATKRPVLHTVQAYHELRKHID